MNATDDYRKWSAETASWTPTEGRVLADAAIAEQAAEIAKMDSAYYKAEEARYDAVKLCEEQAAEIERLKRHQCECADNGLCRKVNAWTNQEKTINEQAERIRELESELATERFNAEGWKTRHDTMKELANRLEAERDALKTELESHLQMAHRWFPDRTFCSACHTEIDEGVTGRWYWHWHRVKDGRGGWYCADCGPLYGTTDQDEVPYSEDCCPDCTAISARRAASREAYYEAIETSSQWTKPIRDAKEVVALKGQCDRAEQKYWRVLKEADDLIVQAALANRIAEKAESALSIALDELRHGRFREARVAQMVDNGVTHCRVGCAGRGRIAP
jgi:hypothetical protein